MQLVPLQRGKGFYSYDAKRKATPDPEGVAHLIAASRAAAHHTLPPGRAVTPGPGCQIGYMYA
jgi:hypothetical protein